MDKLYSFLYGCFLLLPPCMAQPLSQGFEDADIANGGCFSYLGNALSNTDDTDDRVLSGTRSMLMSYTAMPPTPAYYISPALQAGSHVLSFYVKPSLCGSSEAIEIGTTTNPAGDNFSLVCSQNMGCTGPTAWMMVACTLTTDIAHPHLAIRLNGTTKTYYFDDLGITNVGGGLPASCGALLPVDWLGLHAGIQANTVLVKWATASERNNKGFLVERSTAHNGTWSALGFVPGLGNTPVGGEYEFVDDKPVIGTNYYRIRQVDFDGKTKNSPIVSVQNGLRTRLFLSPNPARERLLVHLDADAGRSQLWVVDAMGRVVLEQSVGGAYADLDVSALPRGAYFVRVQGGAGLIQEKVLLR